MDPNSVEPAPSQQTDPLLYRMVVGALSSGLILTVIGGLVLAGMKIDVPGALIAIGAGCMGALGGLLAPSPAR